MNIFHEYDIRGVYARELTDDFAYALGKAIVEYTDAKTIIIGYDSRNSSISLFNAISRSINETGLDVIQAGLITRPMLNYISWKKKYDLGIIITASHNPKEFNGFKFILNGKPLYYSNGLNDVEILVQKIINEKIKFESSKKKGKIIPIDYIDEYVKFLSSNLNSGFKKYVSKKNVRIVIDCSNGASGEIIKRLLLKNNVVFKIINFEPDGNFPDHDPNPLAPNAMNSLSLAVKKFNADFGAILDPDADRIKFVDEGGEIISNNYVDSLIIENLTGKQSIVHDVISRKILSETIANKKFNDVISKVGTSNIIANMIQNKSVFGCEMSGHRYYSIMNNQDSGILTLVNVLNIVYGNKFSKLISKYVKYVDLGELNYKLENHGDSSRIINSIKSYYLLNKTKLGVLELSELDGLKIVCKNYWFTIRKSNTEALIRLRIEGNDKIELLYIKRMIEDYIRE